MTAASVRLWGREIGAVSVPSAGAAAVFQYTPEFAASGIQVAPIVMPVREDPYSFPELAFDSFRGLPGLLSDSLPDRYGNTLIDAWLARQGRDVDTFDAVERLRYVGRRGMGALEFEPDHGPKRSAHPIEIDALVELASEALTAREKFVASFDDDERTSAVRDLLLVGTSAGGARAKALIAWNPTTGEIRSGQVSAGPGFEYWILKFDGVRGNRDKELEDPEGYGAIEYAYYLMARAAGIEMTKSQLLTEGPRRHFMTRRFDRVDGGAKLHTQTLAALAHFDFNLPGAHGYEQSFQICRRLGLGALAEEQMFRRAVFNIVARNQDDHVKNIAFLMEQDGTWTLAPAYDVTYAYNPKGVFTAHHQMTLNGKRDDFVLRDFEISGRTASLKRGAARRIVNEIREVVSEWTTFAAEADVDESHRLRIARAHRLELRDA